MSLQPASAVAPATVSSTQDRPRSRNLRALLYLRDFLLPYRLQIAGASLALIVAATAFLGLGEGVKYLVDHGLSKGQGSALLDKAVLVLLGVAVVLALATYARFYLVSWIGERVVADIRRAVFDHVLTLSPGFFETSRTGEIISRLTTDTSVIQVVIGTSVSIALRNTLMLFGTTAMLIHTSPKLTGIVALVVPAVLVPILFYGRRVRKLSRASQDSVADVSVVIEESIANIRTVQAFTHEEGDKILFARQVEQAFRVATQRISARAWLTAIVILLVFSAISAILWLGGRDLVAGRLSGGDLSAFLFYAVMAASSVAQISEVTGDLQRAAGASERLVELLNTKSLITAPAIPATLTRPGKGAIWFDSVRFRYPTRPDRAALDDVTFSVHAAERLAIVGPSGAGKSTLFQLLLRFYDPEHGDIKFDGVSIRSVEPAAIRQRIGLVAQDAVIFAASVTDNIRYGRPEASDAEIAGAAEAAYASEFIDRLPDRFDTFLGERGVRLSGGQRQRIAIARAILRDPELLLLDEATSALDAESERAVQNALERLMRGRTTMVIAHRLATVVSADRILVMDQGRIVAEGNHATLIQTDGLYARLAALQFNEPDAAKAAE